MKTHYVTVATERKYYMPYLEKLIPDLVILGYNNEWLGFQMRYKLVLEYTRLLEDDDIIVFIDAYDILPTKNFKNLTKKFLEFQKKEQDVKLIVGFCKGGGFSIEELWANYYFGNVNGKRINAGNYLGYVKNVRTILSEILQIFPDLTLDDQVTLTKYANINKKCGIYIDTKFDFFYIGGNALTQITLCENKESCFIHSPGNGFLDKFLLEEHNIDIGCDAERIKLDLINSRKNKVQGYFLKSNVLVKWIVNWYFGYS
jgi:hypothetical protein